MDEVSEVTNINIGRSVPEGKIEKTRAAIRRAPADRKADILQAWDKREVALVGELREKVVANIQLAQTVLEDIGYSEQESQARLPTLDEVHFFTERTNYGTISTAGGVLNGARSLDISIAGGMGIADWDVIGPLLIHELGHFSAQRVVGSPSGTEKEFKLICFGTDTKLKYVEVGGVQYFQPDNMDAYFRGVLREPMADIFGYYCVEKHGEVPNFPTERYYRETAFTVAILEILAKTHKSDFFEEFRKMYRAFNDRDHSYSKYLQQGFADYYLAQGEDPKVATARAREFIKGFNNIISYRGMDEKQIQDEDGKSGVVHGGQLAKVALKAGFADSYAKNILDINGEGLKLGNSVTKMTRYPDQFNALAAAGIV